MTTVKSLGLTNTDLHLHAFENHLEGTKYEGRKGPTHFLRKEGKERRGGGVVEGESTPREEVERSVCITIHSVVCTGSEGGRAPARAE